MEKKKGKLTLRKNINNAEASKEEFIDIPVNEGYNVNSKVTVGEGLTINLGNFESARVDVSVELPCSKGNIQEALLEAESIVDKKLEEIVFKIKGK